MIFEQEYKTINFANLLPYLQPLLNQKLRSIHLVVSDTFGEITPEPWALDSYWIQQLKEMVKKVDLLQAEMENPPAPGRSLNEVACSFDRTYRGTRVYRKAMQQNGSEPHSHWDFITSAF